MSKRKRTSKVEKWIKEGRGTGIGADYGYFCPSLRGVVQKHPIKNEYLGSYR